MTDQPMAAHDPVPGVPGADVVWSDGHPWWWDGQRWLLGTPQGWVRLDQPAEPVEAVQPEPVAAAQSEPAAVVEPMAVVEPEPDVLQQMGAPPEPPPSAAMQPEPVAPEPVPLPEPVRWPEPVAPEPATALPPEPGPVVEVQPEPFRLERELVLEARHEPVQPLPTEPAALPVPVAPPETTTPAPAEPVVAATIPRVARARGARRAPERAAWRPRPSKTFVVVLVVLLLVVVAGAVWLSRSDTPAAGPAPEPSSSAVRIATLGASFLDWSGQHVPATGYPAGTAFDPKAYLPSQAGNPGARYTNVAVNAGRVTAFRFNLIPGSSLAKTMTALSAELPADAKQLSSTPLQTCQIVHLDSVTLSQTLAAVDSSGSIVVVLRSPTVTYDSTDIALADVSATTDIPTRC